MTTPANAPAGQRQESATGANAANAGKGRRGKPRVITGFTKEDMVVRKPRSIEERAKYRRKREERSPIQQTVDKLVLDAYREWLGAGSPRKVMHMPLTVWEVRKAKEDDARFMLGKAAAFIQRQLRYGECPENNGKVELAFYVLDRKIDVEGTDSTDEDETENAAAG